MKVVIVSGEPATGKTTLAQEVVKKLGFGFPFKEGLVSGTYHRGFGTYVIGEYGPGPGFWGTDKLSMAALPQIKSWLAEKADVEPGSFVFMEGDRVTSASFISEIRALYDVEVLVLTAGLGTLNKRHAARKDDQSESFLKGRRTKINNLVNTMLVEVFHEIPTKLLVEKVLEKLGASKKISSTSVELSG